VVSIWTTLRIVSLIHLFSTEDQYSFGLVRSGLGNNKTYRGSKGQRNLPPSRLQIELSSDHEMDSAPPLPPQPTHDPNSPFNATAHTPFLGYPADKRLPHPHASDPDPTSPTPGRPNSVPPGGIPTDSQSLGSPVPTPVPGHTHLPLVAAQSLIPSRRNPRKELHSAQRLDHASSQKRHPPPSTGVAPSQKRALTSTHSAAAKVYGTRLNIIEIHSQRLSVSLNHFY
jgi:hypothetical protein